MLSSFWRTFSSRTYEFSYVVGFWTRKALRYMKQFMLLSLSSGSGLAFWANNSTVPQAEVQVEGQVNFKLRYRSIPLTVVEPPIWKSLLRGRHLKLLVVNCFILLVPPGIREKCSLVHVSSQMGLQLVAVGLLTKQDASVAIVPVVEQLLQRMLKAIMKGELVQLAARVLMMVQGGSLKQVVSVLEKTVFMLNILIS